MATMPQNQLRRLYRVRRGTRAALVLGIAASLAANVLHADDNLVSRVISAWSPVALIVTIELISRVPIASRWLSAARIVGTAAVAGIAAWVSYWHMVDVAQRYGETPDAAHLLPGSVDGLVVVASVCLVEINRQIRALEAAAVPDGAPSETISAPRSTISAPRRETDAPLDVPRLPNGAPDAAEHPTDPSYGALETDGGALIRNGGAFGGAKVRAEIDDQRADPRGAKTISAPVLAPIRADEQSAEIDTHSDQPARPDANDGALIDDGLAPSPPYATKKAHLKALFEALAQDDPRTNYELARDLAPLIPLDEGAARRYLGEWRENPVDQRAEIDDQRAAARKFAPINAPTADDSSASLNGAGT